MRYRDRAGREVCANGQQDALLQKMYGTAFGRRVLSVLIQPGISRLAGRFMDSRISAAFVPGFVEKNHIDLTQYEKQEFSSYNDFFTRKIRFGERPFAEAENTFVAPCDSKLSVYPITADATFQIKDTMYTMESLTRSHYVAKQYEGGVLCVFRLTVDDYHHYAYIDDGEVSREFHIPGVYHTVNPVAGEHYPIYKENTREFCIQKSKHFGNLLLMEVGALLVGRIVNHSAGEADSQIVERGEEKGFFEFGGSTVIVAAQAGQVHIDDDIWQNSTEGIETVVKQGEQIGIGQVSRR